MSFQSPANVIRRRSVEGMEGMHSKMFDPPTLSPDTPDELAPTNPVPEVMAAAGYLRTNPPSRAHTVQRDLMHGDKLPTWDGQDMEFFLFRDADGINAAKDGSFPGPTNRLPRGVIFHCETSGHGPPPHTIHWHGQEPTPMNDGVGHCSMEIGHYIYQWQPNFIGSYFYHCHRNTVQHFEFGLYGFTIIDPPDAFFASIAAFNADGTVALNNVPIGNGRPEPGFPLGRRRIAAYLNPAFNPAFAVFGQDNFNAVDSPDPLAADPTLPAWMKFATDPHACTIPYDVEGLWVLDDRDINWSNLGSNARATYALSGSIPGVNDNFHGNWGGDAGPDGFFAFNDFRSTHFYVTGVPVPDDSGVLTIPGTGEIPHGVVIPPELMSGVPGVQVSISAQLNQTVLLRVLNAAYNNARVTFPVDVVIIAWDGRALGVPPFAKYNQPVLVPAGTPMEWSVARRFDCLIRSAVPVNGFATVEFIDTVRRDVRFTTRIPIHIGVADDVRTFSVSGRVADAQGAGLAGVAVEAVAQGLGGIPPRIVFTDAAGNYSVSGLIGGMYRITPSKPGVEFNPPTTVITIADNGVIGVNFQAVAGGPVPVPTFTVSGTVAMLDGQGLSGVAVTLSGTASAQATTDANGAFSFPGLANGIYTMTPVRAGFTFAPASLPVTVVDLDQTGAHFTATSVDGPAAGFTISGEVVTAGREPAPMGGVTINVITKPGNALAASTVTDGLGAFTVVGLADGKYSVEPSLAGFKFSPKRKSARMTARIRQTRGPEVEIRAFKGKPVR